MEAVWESDALMQKWVFDQHYGVPLAKRFYQTKPLTILDIPHTMRTEALGIADPETPVRTRRRRAAGRRRIRQRAECDCQRRWR